MKLQSKYWLYNNILISFQDLRRAFCFKWIAEWNILNEITPSLKKKQKNNKLRKEQGKQLGDLAKKKKKNYY